LLSGSRGISRCQDGESTRLIAAASVGSVAHRADDHCPEPMAMRAGDSPLAEYGPYETNERQSAFRSRIGTAAAEGDGGGGGHGRVGGELHRDLAISPAKVACPSATRRDVTPSRPRRVLARGRDGLPHVPPKGCEQTVVFTTI